jgi:glycolate oxidase FAD binding subunit
VSTVAVVERVRGAVESRTALRIRGAGGWQDAGRPVRASETLSLADDRGIVEYVPGDLTMTARAGSSLAELDRAARRHGQWLPLAPWGSREATLGATIATATAGPYAATFGLPRDVVLGMEFVTGTGDVVRSGGRVVKNVAGFDLTRLLTGSWGTLGVITEATVRLRALPQTSRTLAIRVDDATEDRIAGLASQVRALPFAPFACEVLNPAMARLLGLAPFTTLLVELGGNPTAVAAQLDLVRALGPVAEAPDGAIEQLRSADSGAPATWRISGKPSRFAPLWMSASATPDVLLHGNPTRGVIRLLATAMAMGTPGEGSSVVFERLPSQDWSRVPVRHDPLAEAVRGKFDPARVLNPGILGEAA